MGSNNKGKKSRAIFTVERQKLDLMSWNLYAFMQHDTQNEKSCKKEDGSVQIEEAKLNFLLFSLSLYLELGIICSGYCLFFGVFLSFSFHFLLLRFVPFLLLLLFILVRGDFKCVIIMSMREGGKMRVNKNYSFAFKKNRLKNLLKNLKSIVKNCCTSHRIAQGDCNARNEQKMEHLNMN